MTEASSLMTVDVQTRPLGDRQCTARSKRTGERCRCAAMLGQRVCYHHGGATPRALAAAQRRLALAEVTKVLGNPVSIGPVDALLEALRLAAGDVVALRNQLAESDVLMQTAMGRVVDPRVLLYLQQVDRLAKLAKLAIDAGIDLVQLTEQQASMMASVFARAVDDPEWGLSPAERTRGRQVLARLLRAEADAARRLIEGTA